MFDYKKFLQECPEESGVYKMLNADHHIIYIGKANNLRKRIRQYFYSHCDPKTKVLRKHLANIDIFTTPSADDALILECNLIKKYKPKFNILLKDDKTYPSIRLSRHPFPSISIHRGPRRDDAEYFGPYPHSAMLRTLMNQLQQIFQIK